MDKIIAVDFDGTIVENKFPEIGEIKQNHVLGLSMIEILKHMQECGMKLILWTCRTGKLLDEAVNFCKEQGLIFDAVNDDLESQKEIWGDKLEEWKNSGKARKVYAHFYLDDRALPPDILFKKLIKGVLDDLSSGH